MDNSKAGIREDDMQTIILECDTIRLVPLSLSDTDLIKSLQVNCGGNGCLEGSDACKAMAAEKFVQSALQSQDDFGVSRWKVEAQDGEFLGWAGFTPLSETSEISLGYCLPSTHGKISNVPRRLCKALTDWFFRETYFSHLVSVVRVDNRAMREVILDAGFTHRESKAIGGMQADLFQMLSPSMQTYLMSA
jgi:ribosomal-protein-alanine N-acetyltransferase